MINAEGDVILDVIDVADMNNFDLTRQWYDWGSENPFKGLPHEDPRNHIEELESLVSRRKKNEISEDHILCKIFPYTISGGAFSWLKNEIFEDHILCKIFPYIISGGAFSWLKNEISEDHILCKIFPYTISGGAFSWLKNEISEVSVDEDGVSVGSGASVSVDRQVLMSVDVERISLRRSKLAGSFENKS